MEIMTVIAIATAIVIVTVVAATVIAIVMTDFNIAITDLEKAIELNTNIKSLFGISDWRISSCFSWNSDCNLLIGQSKLKQK
jgi:hypothetical protein